VWPVLRRLTTRRTGKGRSLSLWAFLLWLVAAQLAALLGAFELARLWL
jgi:hypothetical protein